MKNMGEEMSLMMTTMESNIKRRNHQRIPQQKSQLVLSEAVNQRAKFKKRLKNQTKKLLLLLELLRFLKLKLAKLPRNLKVLLVRQLMAKESLELALGDYLLILKHTNQLSRNINLQRKRKAKMKLVRIPKHQSKTLKRMGNQKSMEKRIRLFSLLEEKNQLMLNELIQRWKELPLQIFSLRQSYLKNSTQRRNLKQIVLEISASFVYIVIILLAFCSLCV